MKNKKVVKRSTLKIKNEVIKMKRWTEKEIDYLMKHFAVKEGDYKVLAEKLNKTEGSIIAKSRRLGLPNVKINSQSQRNNLDLGDKLFKLLSHSKKEHTIEELSDKFDVCVAKVKGAIYNLKRKNILVDVVDDKITLGRYVQPAENKIVIPLKIYDNRWIRFGLLSDTHLNSKYQRLEVLNAIYDICKKEDLHHLFHSGNIIDGYGRFNRYDVLNAGTDEQIRYCIENYPQREGITTHFITADDHEGWIVQREHINIGKSIQQEAKSNGREDLNFLGHVEADVLFKVGSKPTRLRLFHPGGGISYAMSYQPQKIVESMSGGEKPDILAVGHYHKLGAFDWRNVDVLLTGCVEDQTPFMRKKHIAAHIGFYIITANIAPDGSINRIIPEKIKFYDKRYYTLNGWKRTPAEFEKPVNWFYKW